MVDADRPVQDQQGQPAGSPPVAEPSSAVPLAIGLAALLQGLPDPWLPSRLRRLVDLVRAEGRVRQAYQRATSELLRETARRVVLPGGHVDPAGAWQPSQRYAQALDDTVSVVLEDAYQGAWHDASDDADWTPDDLAQVRQHLDRAVNRMRHTPDEVYRLVVAEVQQAAEQGTPMPELAARIEDLLIGKGVAVWQNRGMVVARTETIAAYNAGTYAGWLSYARQLGGDWEKGWLATHDSRTRPTHRAADLETPLTGQRVALTAPFSVGGAMAMFPGDPALPPQERIQCRCSMVLLRPGENVDLSARHLRRSS